MQEAQHIAKAAAYRQRVLMACRPLKEATAASAIFASMALFGEDESAASQAPMRTAIITGSEELRPANWERHALLDLDVVQAINDAHIAVTVLEEFCAEMHGRSIDEVSKFAVGIAQTETPGGGTEITFENAAQTHLRVADDANRKIDALIKLLEKK